MLMYGNVEYPEDNFNFYKESGEPQCEGGVCAFRDKVFTVEVKYLLQDHGHEPLLPIRRKNRVRNRRLIDVWLCFVQGWDQMCIQNCGEIDSIIEKANAAQKQNVQLAGMRPQMLAEKQEEEEPLAAKGEPVMFI